MQKLEQTWDLASLFEGGSKSKALKESMQEIEASLDTCQKSIDSLGDQPNAAWKKTIIAMQALDANLSEVCNFAECLEAQDTADSLATQLTGILDGLRARNQSLGVQLETRFLQADDAAWESLLSDSELAPIAFSLSDQRDLAGRKMDPEKEMLTGELAKDGYHAWGRLYDKLAGSLRVDFQENGSSETLSMGQLHNKMESVHAGIRRSAFEKLEEAWSSVADLSAMALNNQAGFRLTTYKKRNWDSVLYEPLRMNRMSRETLEAMWGVVADKSAELVPYIEAKASLLGQSKMTWYDKSAPVSSDEKSYSYEEAAQYIMEQFGKFSQPLADFARQAFDKRWIEVEDRQGKGAGGFCTDFPDSQETRIFMTFGGTFGGVSTLAHELGHAHHTWILRKKPFWATEYPMTLAETASTFCETLITDSALKSASNDEEKLNLLDKKLDEAATMMMNLRSRFLFETSFFAERESGPLTVDRLNELMKNAQVTAYAGALDDHAYHPLFWASKLHFYITSYPFYNFPYVFGFLFSNGIYDRAIQEGPSFSKKYVALLEDTGSMTCEDLAKKHLGVDLIKPDFWEASVERALQHVDPFVKLARARTTV